MEMDPHGGTRMSDTRTSGTRDFIFVQDSSEDSQEKVEQAKPQGREGQRIDDFLTEAQRHLNTIFNCVRMQLAQCAAFASEPLPELPELVEMESNASVSSSSSSSSSPSSSSSNRVAEQYYASCCSLGALLHREVEQMQDRRYFENDANRVPQLKLDNALHQQLLQNVFHELKTKPRR